MCLTNASFFRYERTSKLLSRKNKATPTLLEKANSLKFYQCFLSYCFEILQSPCKALHYCTIISLKNFWLFKYRATCAFFFHLDGNSDDFTYQTSVLSFFSNDIKFFALQTTTLFRCSVTDGINGHS